MGLGRSVSSAALTLFQKSLSSCAAFKSSPTTFLMASSSFTLHLLKFDRDGVENVALYPLFRGRSSANVALDK